MVDGWLDGVAAALGAKKSAVIIAFIAAVLSLRFVPEMTNWKSRLSMTAGGFFCSIYITPGLAEVFEFKEKTEYALTFGMGLLGMSIVAASIKIIANGELWGLVRDKFGGRRGDQPVVEAESEK